MNKKTLCIDLRMHNASGIGRYITNIVPYLLDSFNVILLGQKSEVLEKYSWAKNLDTIDCSAKIYSIKEQFELFLKVPKCDIFWSPHYNVPILPIRAKKRIVTIHDVYHLAFADTLSLMQKVYSKLVMDAAVHKSDTVLTDSEFSKNEINKFIPNKKQIEIVYCAVDGLNLIQNSVKPYDFDYILYVGNVKPHKNLKRSIEAYKLLGLQNIKFVIVGKKDNFITTDDNTLEMADDNIIFTGLVPDEKLMALYRYAKAFIFISLYEGFGLPPLEAQINGCPVLTSTCASLPEVCGKGALYCNAYNIDDISEKLQLILSDEILRGKLIENGLENIKRFSWQKSANTIIEIFKKL
ncbi:MAG: hypothetical protein RL154_777 [Pseudomonadota bacterium]|jgi:glycosyltransferase involved in cell wall biosynthesis